MKINLSEPFTTKDVSKLIASKDDSEHRQLRVTYDGIAYLSDDVGIDELEGVLFRLETFAAGNGYTGQSAANDKDFITRIENALRKNWPVPTTSYIDTY